MLFIGLRTRRHSSLGFYDKLAVGGHFCFVTSDGTPAYPLETKRALSVLISPDFEDNLMYRKQTYVDVVVKYLNWTSVDHFLSWHFSGRVQHYLS